MTLGKQRLVYWSVAGLWMGLIYLGSTDLLSDPRTSRFLGPLLRWLIPGISDATIELLRAPIRKAGHLAEYAILAGLIMSALQTSFDPRRWAWRRQPILLCIALCTLYAMSDEWHQSWVPTRQGSPIDVAIDTLGASAGLLLLSQFRRRQTSSPRPGEPPETGFDKPDR